MTTVNHVTISVRLLLDVKETMLSVILTESMNQPVYVQMEPMKSNYRPIVHIVNLNVLDVTDMPAIVSLVLKDMLTHQNVQSLQPKFLLLELKISQSDLSKFSTVLSLVKPVKNIQTPVSFVKKTELTHQLVTVLMNTSLIQQPENVSNVTTDVLTVTLFLPTVILNVLSVLKIVSFFHIVNAQMDSMTSKAKLNVKNVQKNVKLVTLMDVSLVMSTESIQKLVHVEMVCMKISTKNVNLVVHIV
jgi:hypothetical protein